MALVIFVSVMKLNQIFMFINSKKFLRKRHIYIIIPFNICFMIRAGMLWAVFERGKAVDLET